MSYGQNFLFNAHRSPVLRIPYNHYILPFKAVLATAHMDGTKYTFFSDLEPLKKQVTEEKVKTMLEGDARECRGCHGNQPVVNRLDAAPTHQQSENV